MVLTCHRWTHVHEKPIRHGHVLRSNVQPLNLMPTAKVLVGFKSKFVRTTFGRRPFISTSLLFSLYPYKVTLSLFLSLPLLNRSSRC